MHTFSTDKWRYLVHDKFFQAFNSPSVKNKLHTPNFKAWCAAGIRIRRLGVDEISEIDRHFSIKSNTTERLPRILCAFIKVYMCAEYVSFPLVTLSPFL